MRMRSIVAIYAMRALIPVLRLEATPLFWCGFETTVLGIRCAVLFIRAIGTDRPCIKRGGLRRSEKICAMVFKGSFDYVFTLATFVSAAFTLLCYLVLSPLLSRRLVKAYRTLKHKDHWNTLLSSTIHALISTVLSLIVILGGYIDDYVLSESTLGFLTLQISLGYFLGDFLVVMSSESLRRDIGVVCHHLASGVGILLTLYYEGHCLFFAVYRLIGELSTPFVNLRWILQQTHMPKTSKWYIVAAVGMTGTFFISRIVPIPWHWMVTISTMTDEASFVIPFKYRVFMVVSYLVLDLLNLFWMYKIGKGIFKFIRVLGSMRTS